MRKFIRVLTLLGCGCLATSFAQASSGDTPSAWADCLPPGIKLADIVQVIRAGGEGSEATSARSVTVAQKLQELKATCHGANKLVDGGGKEIVFFPLQGCWGNPPPDYQEILQKQREEIERLARQYTVIEMTCHPAGVRIP